MLTFFSFLLTFFGTFNWFFIGAFQYDIVAGFFGYQASLLSRLVYFLIGMAGFVLVFMAIKNKGYIKITENSFKNKKNVKKEEENREKEDFEYIYKPEPISEKPVQKGEYKDFDITKYD